MKKLSHIHSIFSIAVVAITLMIAPPSVHAQDSYTSEVTEVILTETSEVGKCVIDCNQTQSKPGGGPVKPGGDDPGGIVPGGTTPGASPTPIPPGGNSGPILPSNSGIGGNAGVIINHLLTIGNRVWDFILSNRPGATYDTLKASVLPSGLESWVQLQGWSRPQVKKYRVDFKSRSGEVVGGFEYRITFISGGNIGGKGQFIGEIAVAPENIRLQTGRTVTFKAEILDPLNFGNETNPIAGVQLLITWSSPTLTRYEMHSREYFLYGTGEIQDLSL